MWKSSSCATRSKVDFATKCKSHTQYLICRSVMFVGPAKKRLLIRRRCAAAVMKTLSYDVAELRRSMHAITHCFSCVHNSPGRNEAGRYFYAWKTLRYHMSRLNAFERQIWYFVCSAFCTVQMDWRLWVRKIQQDECLNKSKFRDTIPARHSMSATR